MFNCLLLCSVWIRLKLWCRVLSMFRVRMLILSRLIVLRLFLFYWIIVCLVMLVFFIGIRVFNGCLEMMKLLGCCERWCGKLINLLVRVSIWCRIGFCGLKLVFFRCLVLGVWLF